MQGWGVERDIDHTLAALSIARLVRGLTGQGFGPLNLLGFSYGAFVAYGAAGRETQQHRILRDIKGIIPVDQGLKYDLVDAPFMTTACEEAAAAKAMLDAGNYANTNGLFFSTIGQLAKNQPNDPYDQPPLNALGLTNIQVTIFLGANTYFPGDSPAPFWHFAGGNQGMPFEIATGLAYTDLNRWVNLAAALPPYQPQQTGYEVRACLCDEEDVSFDDHLMEISLPIFYLGAGGGFGTLGQHTASLTASAAIETVVVSTQPERYKDFGHADLFVANDAPGLAWEPLRQWLLGHHGGYLP
jgi:hypothetical protein